MRERVRERVRERSRVGKEDWVRRGRNRKDEFAVYVLNLPRLLDRYGMFGIFQKAGQVLDTYIPLKQRKDGRKYGFVRFRNEEDVRRCIKLFHGALIRGNEIIVSRAKPKRKLQQIFQGHQQQAHFIPRQRPRQKWVWRPKERKPIHNGEEVMFKDEVGRIEMAVTGETNEENEDWLSRSLVGRVEEPRDLASLSSALQCDFDPDVKIGALSSFQYLVTFPSETRMKEAFEQKEMLFQWFSDVKIWGVEDRCEARRVWLNIVGVPPQGWLWENFKKIAEVWGKLVCLGKQTKATDSFEVMRACIVTKLLQRISGEVVLLVGSCGYRIMISEAETICQTCHSSTNIGAPYEDDHVPGFEDLEDMEESENENICSSNQKQIGEDEAEVSFSNSKTRKGQESFRSNERKQANSSTTKTKTVSFTAGNSMEMCRDRQKLKALVARECNEGSSSVSLPPPGFEFESPNLIQHESNQTNSGVVPEVNNSSETTTDSLKQLAHESLQVGELLGVKVIGDYKAALSRITKPLKKNI